MPKRIQRKRTRGWRTPKGAVYVGRPSIFGNPFEVGKSFLDLTLTAPLYSVMPAEEVRQRLFHEPEEVFCKTSAESIHWYRKYVEWLFQDSFVKQMWLDRLRGQDLCCWCKLSEPCHADALLELANK